MQAAHVQHSTVDPRQAWQPVIFRYSHPTARSVCVAGSFNGWQMGTKPLRSLGQGRWEKESSLPPGTYEYQLVVDGKWLPDPLAVDTVANPFGGRNSLLIVEWTHPVSLQTAKQQQASTVIMASVHA
jgi:1,4-alpha-glucan branching enzyme